jgi:hypothetical protein
VRGVSSSRAAIGEGPVLSGFCRRLIVIDMALAVFEPEAVAVHLEDMNVVGKAIEQRATRTHVGDAQVGELLSGTRCETPWSRSPDRKPSPGE